ncbi:Protein tyrosine kinase Protein kinase domain [Trypanosoma vivax]|nr:hypothetical protein TRVL_06535 [Trypanosoma vivax]KAH8618505.1 Protein tyrosine kinase Protein kinase domain [Trypanosoma vivax]
MSFNVVRRLAEGACADVFLVRLEKRVEQEQWDVADCNGFAALKLAKPGCEEVTLVEAIELRRANSHGSHPHIVPLLGYFISNNLPRGLVLEYCRGGSLGDYLKGGVSSHKHEGTALEGANRVREHVRDNCIWEARPRGSKRVSQTTGISIPVDVSWKFMMQILDALLFLESMQLWHHDLKPDNVLLTSSTITEASVKLSDFGFARRTPYSKLRCGGSSGGTAAGSPSFMSPERLRQFNAVTRGRFMSDTQGDYYHCSAPTVLSYCRSKAEVWAAGLIFFAMVCGHHIFHKAKSIKELIDAQTQVLSMVRCEKRLNEAGTAPVLSLLIRMLDPEPSSRPGLREVRNYLCFSGIIESCPIKLSARGGRQQHRVHVRRKANRSPPPSTPAKILVEKLPTRPLASAAGSARSPRVLGGGHMQTLHLKSLDEVAAPQSPIVLSAFNHMRETESCGRSSTVTPRVLPNKKTALLSVREVNVNRESWEVLNASQRCVPQEKPSVPSLAAYFTKFASGVLSGLTGRHP